MADLVVIVPTRGRPEAARALLDAFAETVSGEVHLHFAVDHDDPTQDEYAALVGPMDVIETDDRPSTMVRALNAIAVQLVNADDAPFAVGFMGDDHRPRTKGWDERYLECLRELGTGMVYGDDLLQRQALPTQIAMTSDIVRELGWMSPPELVHMYVDNWWLQLGTQADCIRYLPDVVVEHVHPIAGKAVWDEGHQRVNAPEMYHRDQTTFARLRVLELPGAVAKVRALRGES
jgi:hypothetical protein